MAFAAAAFFGAAFVAVALAAGFAVAGFAVAFFLVAGFLVAVFVAALADDDAARGPPLEDRARAGDRLRPTRPAASLSRRSWSSSAARSLVTSSTSSPRRSEAFVSPSVT